MKPAGGQTITEPAREVPVYGHCDVLVVGGGPAGTAAAIAAARTGADVVLVERYGHLGGLSTGGLVCWIDRMTDWDGRLVVGGVGHEFMERCDAEPGGLTGPPRALWGSRDPEQVRYWAPRNTAHRGIVTWAPTVDPEVLKALSLDMVREAGATMLFHTWAVAAVREEGRVRGAIFESKEGRRAILAKVTIDCSGDGDIFADAGARFESEIDSDSIHALMNTCARIGGVDTDRYWQFRVDHPDEFSALLRQADAENSAIHAGPMPRDGQVVVMYPKFAGYSAINVADLSAVELRSRDALRRGLEWFRAHVPGFEQAYMLETAPQIGVRHSRRLIGTSTVTFDRWRSSGRYADSIGLCPGTTPNIPTLEIPYGCLVPAELDGVLAAGRNLSCDPQSHNALREIPECWVLGQAAGLAATLAVRDAVQVRDISVPELQDTLRKQGAIVDRPGEAVAVPVVASG